MLIRDGKEVGRLVAETNVGKIRTFLENGLK